MALQALHFELVVAESAATRSARRSHVDSHGHRVVGRRSFEKGLLVRGTGGTTNWLS